MINRFWNGWTITQKISEGGFGEIYKATKEDGTVCAIKHIRLPKDEHEIESLIKNRTIQDKSQVETYIQEMTNHIQNEIEIMQQFNGNPYIIDCYDFLKETDKNGAGSDFYIRMEYAMDLETYLQTEKIDVNDVIQMAIDVCTALELCASLNIVHNDIKPNNIFIGSDQHYKLGDFGAVAPIGSIPHNMFGTVSYMAPEAYKQTALTSSTDLYALGLVMYQLLDGKLPFVTKTVSEEQAVELRMNGGSIPSIKGLDPRVMAIISKACSFTSKDRYHTPTEMKKDLEKIGHIKARKKKITFTTNKRVKTLSIFAKEIPLKGKNNRYIDTLQKSSLVAQIKDFFKEKRTLKLVLFLLILILVILGIRGCTQNKTCQTGYVNDNGKCVKGYYYCDSGYILNQENKCQKTIESIDAKFTYTCPKGYVLNDTTCISEDVRDPQLVYKCADGFVLNGTKCQKEESVDAGVVYTCPSKYVLVDNQCVTISNIGATPEYKCLDSSYQLSGTTCSKNVSTTVKATSQYSCPSGGTLKGTTCEIVTNPTYTNWYVPTCSKGTYNYMDRMCHETYAATLTYTCSQGVSDGKGNCTSSSTVTLDAIVTYTCPVGYTLAGNQCAKTSGIEATKKYICTDDTELRGSKCYAMISTDSVQMYECPEGFVISGTKCYQNDFPEATKKYSCSKVYTLNGDKCEKYEKVTPKVHLDEKELK